jgi:hypothetical protein
VAKKQSRKKRWQVEEEGLNPVQKGIIVSIIAFIPFFFLVLIPLLARDHFVKKLKIPSEVFLSPPQMIKLEQTGNPGETFKVRINGVEFKIPVDFTPVKVSDRFAAFKDSPRKMAKNISIFSSNEPRKIKFTATGFARWFMPNTVLEFMQKILRSSWHPIYLMFKAQFFASEGITSKVFEARWDAHHRGFILPLAGQSGYVGRIFRTNKPGYFEFMMRDDIKAVTLQQWVDLAMKIRPPTEQDIPEDPFAPGFYNLDYLTEQALDKNSQVEVLSRSLNEFFRTRKPMWLIPVAIIMRERGFNSELIDIHKQYLNAFPVDSPLKNVWNSILDETVEDTLKIEIDKTLRKKKLNIYCKNLVDKQISQILIRINIKYNDGSEGAFITTLLDNNRLFERQEKSLQVTVPSDMSLFDIEKIDYRIMQIDFFD